MNAKSLIYYKPFFPHYRFYIVYNIVTTLQVAPTCTIYQREWNTIRNTYTESDVVTFYSHLCPAIYVHANRHSCCAELKAATTIILTSQAEGTLLNFFPESITGIPYNIFFSYNRILTPCNQILTLYNWIVTSYHQAQRKLTQTNIDSIIWRCYGTLYPGLQQLSRIVPLQPLQPCNTYTCLNN